MDKLICFCLALLTSLCVYSASSENSPVEPKSSSLTSDDSFKQELPALPAYGEPSQSRNNSYMGEVEKLQPVSNTYAENEPVTISTKFTDEGNDVTVSKDNLPPVFIYFEHKSDVGSSPTFNTNNYHTDSSQPVKAFLPLESKSTESGGETTDSTRHDYRGNEGLKDFIEYTEDGDDDIDLEEHDNDDDDDDDTKWSEHGDDDNESDWEEDTEDDDFDEQKNPQDEVATKKRQPTAPTKMVLFYTWMVVAVLLIIIGISTYQSRCRGFRFFGAKGPNPKDDRKRLMEHEFV